MPHVRHRSKIFNTTFKRLRNADVYYLSATSGPFIKTGKRLTLKANVFPLDNGSAAGETQTAVADVSVAVKRVPAYLLGSNRHI